MSRWPMPSLARAAIGAVLLIALGAGGADARVGPRPLPIRASLSDARTSAGADGLLLRIRTVRGARCDVTLRAGRSQVHFAPLTLRRGQSLAWRWAIPNSAPAGLWKVTVACRKGNRRGSDIERIFVRPSKPKPTGHLVAPSSAEATGGGGGGCDIYPGREDNRYCFHQCTWYVKERFPEIPNGWGNAGDWAGSAARRGYRVDHAPARNAVVVWGYNQVGGGHGHAGVVEAVDANGGLRVSDYNYIAPYTFWNNHYVGPGEAAQLSFIHIRDAAPPPADHTPHFTDLHVYSSQTLAVTAGDQVRAVVTAKYLGPDAIPCGLANLGTRNDQPGRFADLSPGLWPASPWRSNTRVAADGCNGNLDPGEYVKWTLTFRPPAGTAPGNYPTGAYAPVWEGRQWSDFPPFTIGLDVHAATTPPPPPPGSGPDPDPGPISGVGRSGVGPWFDDVHVYSSQRLDVTAGDTVKFVITARLVGPSSIPCGNADAGTRDDRPIRWANPNAGVWFRGDNRVAAVNCIGALDPGEYGRWDIAVKPPVGTARGTYSIGTIGLLYEGRAWSDLTIPLAVRIG